MATTSDCGSTGTCSLGGEITSWSVTLRVDAVDATSMASGGYGENIACLKDASFTFESLTLVGTIGANAALNFTNDKASYTFNAIIESINTTVDVNDVVKFVISGVSTGAIT